jgi:hypothetical protein
MESRIRIKLGQMEVEYEGSEAFIKQELLDFVEKVSALHNMLPGREARNSGGDDTLALKLSTKSIAGMVGCKSGRDLVLSAAAHFTFSRATESFTRQQLLTEMQTAGGGYYKKSYSNNMTKYLDGLVKDGDLNEGTPAGTYSLSPNRRKTLEGQLAPGN